MSTKRRGFAARMAGMFLVAGTFLGAANATPAPDPVKQAANDLRGAIWIEGEEAVDSNWPTGPATMLLRDGTGASGGLYLRLVAEKSPAADALVPFYAIYRFEVRSEGLYRLWLGASPQNCDWSCPFYYQLDNGPFVYLKGKSPAGTTYGAPGPAYPTPRPDQFLAWTLADAVQLSAGTHTLRIEVRELTPAAAWYIGALDAMLMTTDPGYVPDGNHPEYSPHPTWEELTKTTSYEQIMISVEDKLHRLHENLTAENYSPASTGEATRKIMARPLPKRGARSTDAPQFGVCMIQPFINHGNNAEATERVYQRAYEMLARAGAETVRTPLTFWHRLGLNYDKFAQLDHLMAETTSKYGMKLMVEVTYPPQQYNIVDSGRSAIKPEYEDLLRRYLQAVFNRCKGKMAYVEVGNEMDVYEVWYPGGTPATYVRDCRIVKEELLKVDPDVKVVAFGATGSRPNATGGLERYRDFVRECFNLGIGNHVDGFSLHYTWELAEREFPAFFRAEMKKRGIAKPLVNSEESAFWLENRPRVKPYSLVKIFARDLFLYGYEAVYYFLDQDMFENDRLLPVGLFDMNGNPKLRLLAYALSVDAMKHRRLVGIAEPAPGVEAYVLEYRPGHKGEGPAYAVVMWKNRQQVTTTTEVTTTTATAAPSPGEKTELAAPGKVTGLAKVVSALNWKLDAIPFDRKDPAFDVGDEPVVVFANRKPPWRVLSPAQWLAQPIEKGIP